MALCLVTGGAGFIGSHLVEALVAGGDQVRVLDNFSTGTVVNLDGARRRIEVIRGDVTDPGAVRRATEGVELVFHNAADPSIMRSLADPARTNHVATTGTLNVLVSARDAGVRRVICAASASAYGEGAAVPLSEDLLPRPISPYAVAQLAAEQYCAAFTSAYGLETVRLRYFNAFGPRQPLHHPYAAVIPAFVEAIGAGRRPVIYGHGLQSRDFTHVDDIVQANLLAAEAPRASGRVYNIGSGRRTTLLELVDKINTVLGADTRPLYVVPRPGEIRHSQADISRAQAELGYCPCTELISNLHSCLTFITKRPKQYRYVHKYSLN
jgi:UDP-glucose 4-epimerase